ncbi:MAG TPA: hypothetical protein VGS80_09510 [Ktedonobacterales bacterium]|nr:hypothetical protein [Ktedonobacterales bacterium]
MAESAIVGDVVMAGSMLAALAIRAPTQSALPALPVLPHASHGRVR